MNGNLSIIEIDAIVFLEIKEEGVQVLLIYLLLLLDIFMKIHTFIIQN